MYSIYFMKLETHGKFHFIVLISGLPYCQCQRLIQKTERSDTIILGTLVQFRHFRHFFWQLDFYTKRSSHRMQKK
jgi:hypothetical protein